MASYLTDEAREEQYAKNRLTRNRLDKTFDILMWGTLLISAYHVLGSAIGGIAALLAFRLDVVLTSLCVIGSTAAAVLAIYQKKVKFTFLMLAIVLFLSVVCFPDTIHLVPILLVTAFVSYQWEKLSQEEGFPLFDISYRELEERQKNVDNYIKNRALQSGARIAEADTQGNMPDLLDADTDTPALAATLTAYRTRLPEESVVHHPTVQPDSGSLDAHPLIEDEMRILEEMDYKAPEQNENYGNHENYGKEGEAL